MKRVYLLGEILDNLRSRSKSNSFLDRLLSVYILVIFLTVSVLGLGFVLVREVVNIFASQSCPGTVISSNTTWTADGVDGVIDCTGQTVTVQSGATLTLDPNIVDDNDSSNDWGVTLLAANFVVEPGARVETSGYLAGEDEGTGGVGGSGVGETGASGGGHGGAGGLGDSTAQDEPEDAGTVYGSENMPITLGSGGGSTATTGGSGGVGGGAIKIELTGTLTLDGELNADGGNGEADLTSLAGGGGGAGGSIWVSADTLEGSGSTSVNGGDGGVSTNVGGGGGGGRLVMLCETANNYSGTVSVDGGIGGDQDGQVGSQIGPTCYPDEPTNLTQYMLDGTTEIIEGGKTQENAVVFKFDMNDPDNPDTLYPQVEILPIVSSFTGAPTKTGSGLVYTGSPQNGEVTVFNLARGVQYHWRARVRDEQGATSGWVSYGIAADGEADVILIGQPTTLIRISGDSQTGTVNTQLADPFVVEVRDQYGIGVPDITLTWQVTSGGGSVSNGTSVTDFDGVTQTTLTLGPEAGSLNNRVNAIRSGLTNSPMQFAASASAGVVSDYIVTGPSISLINTDFDPCVQITAVDSFGNLVVSATDNVNLSAVMADNTAAAGSGNLTPTSATLVDGEVTVCNVQYDTAESIRVKVDDGTADGFSNVVTVVTEFGDCFGFPNAPGDLILDVNYSINADNVPGGVIDCSQVDLIVQDNATISLNSYDDGDTTYSVGDDYGITLLANSLYVASGSIIEADAGGYGSARGPGKADPFPFLGNGSGAGYGGYGSVGGSGLPGGQPYGSVYQPNQLGSGATTVGGGAIKFEITDNVIIEGEISADGAAFGGNGGREGTGSGGSIWISTDKIGGAGLITANGGVATGGSSGSGSGGRVAVYYAENISGNEFGVSPVTSASIQARCSSGGIASGAGTIYIENTASHSPQQGELFVDNNGRNSSYHAVLVEDSYLFDSVTLTNYGHIDILGQGSVITVPDGSSLTGDTTKPNLAAYGTFDYTGLSTLFINGVDVTIQGDISGVTDVTVGDTVEAGFTLYPSTWARSGVYTFGSMTIGQFGTLTLPGYDSGNECNSPDDSGCYDDFGVTINADNILIETGGLVTADGQGYAAGRGPGAGTLAPFLSAGSGAGYGGYGKTGSTPPAGEPYGDVYEPSLLGSSANGKGGGAIHLNVTNDLLIDGLITATAANVSGDSGPGSGGSIWLVTDNIAGSGIVRANGDDSGSGGDGGGGRIAIYYNQIDPTNPIAIDPVSNSQVQAFGIAAGAGTIYVENTGIHTEHQGELFVDNNGIDSLFHAGLVAATYQFDKITLTNYGHLDVIGQTSEVIINSASAFDGDSTLSDLEVFGTLRGPQNTNVNGLDLHIRGDIQLGSSMDTSAITVGNTKLGRMYVWANTFAHPLVGPLSSYDFGDIIVDDLGEFHSVIYEDGDSDYNDEDGGVAINANNVLVESNGVLGAEGTGYQFRITSPAIAGRGRGGLSQAGGVHGGYGVSNTLEPYGGAYEPTSIGSSGGGCSGARGSKAGGWGGGVLNLNVDDTLTLYGHLSADGGTVFDYGVCDNSGGSIVAFAGGGSGGSLWLDVNNLVGDQNSIISANGGQTHRHGSAGRVALYYNSITDFPLDVDHVQARGGDAGPGTVYLEDKTTDIPKGARLHVDNNGDDTLRAGLEEGDYQFDLVELTRYGHLDILGNDSNFTITSSESLHGDETVPFLRVFGTIDGPVNTAIGGLDVGIRGDKSDTGFTNVTIGTEKCTDSTFLNETDCENASETWRYLKGGLSVYEHTWAHTSRDDNYVFGDVVIGSDATLTTTGTDSSFTARFGTETVNYAEDALIQFDTITVNNGGSVYYNGFDSGDTNWTNDYGFIFEALDVTVDPNGQISAEARGYQNGGTGAGRGPGLGNQTSGAYGGYGDYLSTSVASNLAAPSGQAYEPDLLGSAGGGCSGSRGSRNGGHGGGHVSLYVENTLTLNGLITSNGGEASGDGPCDNSGGSIVAWSGSGSGGSIFVDASEISGTGMLTANGGTQQADGSGGRIGIYYQSLSGGFDISNDTLQARGGNAGPGTVYVEQLDGTRVRDYDGKLYVNNNNNNGRQAGLISGDYLFGLIELTGYGHLDVLGEDSSLTITGSGSLHGDSTISDLTFYGTVNAPTNMAIGGVDVGIRGAKSGFSNVTLGTDKCSDSDYLNEVDCTNASETWEYIQGGLTVFEHTWAHNQRDENFVFGSLTVGSSTEELIAGNDSTFTASFTDNTEIDYGENALIQFGNITINSGASVFIDGFENINSDYTDDYGYTLDADDITIHQNAIVSATGNGYQNGTIGNGRGPGGTANAGGSYGGYGNSVNPAIALASTYGDLYLPQSLGSSGSGCSDIRGFKLGGAGGGHMTLQVSGTLTLNGTIESNGGPLVNDSPCENAGTTVTGWGGSGAGGSILIDANAISGSASGSITANGGSEAGGGGGGGGRIALFFDSISGFSITSSTVQTRGGGGSIGGPGTVYWENRSVNDPNYGDITIDNNGSSGANGSDFEPVDYTFTNVVVGENIRLLMTGNTASDRGVFFDILGDFTLGAGSYLDADLQGWGPGTGPGKGNDGTGSSGGGGGSHGGAGGRGQNDGSNPEGTGGVGGYGNAIRPTQLGSGGGASGAGARGGAGGGAIAIVSTEGDVSILGTISAVGENGTIASPGGGGGAGGSIYLSGDDVDCDGGSLDISGGDGGDEIFDGGGGGGGYGVVLYQSSTDFGTCTVDDSEGSSAGGQDGGDGVFGINGIPAAPNTTKDQFRSDATTNIPVGGSTNETEVVLKFDMTDPDTGVYDLTPQVELIPVSGTFNEDPGDIFTGSDVSYNGTVGTPVEGEVGVTSLTLGESYKWRARVIDELGVASTWSEYGGNPSSAADFIVSTVASIEITASPSTIDAGESVDLVVTAYDASLAVDSTYTGTVTFSSTDGSASLPSSYSFTGSDGGTRTFTSGATLYTSGVQTVSVNDSVNNLSDTSNDITVTGTASDPPPTIFNVNEDVTETTVTITWETDEPTIGQIQYGETIFTNTTTLESVYETTHSQEVTGLNTSTNYNYRITAQDTPLAQTDTYDGTFTTAACSGASCGDIFIGPDGYIFQFEYIRAADITNTSAVIEWGTNHLASAVLQYGLTSNYSSSIEVTDFLEGHDELLEQLEADTLYHYQIAATDEQGNTIGSNDFTFKTLGLLPETGSCVEVYDSLRSIENMSVSVDARTFSSSSCTVMYGTDSDNLDREASAEEIESNLHRGEFGVTCNDRGKDMFYQWNCTDANGVVCESRSFTITAAELEREGAFNSCLGAEVSFTVPGFLLLLLPLTGLLWLLFNNSILFRPSLMLLAFPSLFGKEKKAPWGIVYDSSSKEPIAFAVVRLFSKGKKKLLEQKVSDLKGRYSFVIEEGEYVLVVEHEDYATFERDTKFDEKGVSVNLDVPLEKPHKMNAISTWFRKFKFKYNENIREIQITIFIIGFLLSIIASVVTPERYNLIVLGLYILVLIVYIIYLLTRSRDWGFVYDTKSKVRVPRAFVRLFKKEDNKLIDTQLTDELGRYGFLVDPGEYMLLVNAQGYSFPSKREKKKKLKKTFYGSLIRIVVTEEGISDLAIGVDPIQGAKKAPKSGPVEKFASPFGG